MPEKSETRQTCQVVAWDLDTTGRKLIDEICQIGGYFRTHDKETEDNTFSQYVMPYRNPNPGARRSFGIKVLKNILSVHDKNIHILENNFSGLYCNS